MSNVRAHLIVSGKVQGVYFRVETCDQAAALGLTGWVQNMPDRNVEVVVEGSRDGVENLINWCRLGPPGAEVSGVSVTWENYTGEFDKFNIAF
ncbi:acylphosphatase [Pelotomaculum propionicicum]|uniref:acylphosphatase n=1 Tax=Pelotomaculum propionicicum TaxID=258475 RepID=UPI003B7EF2FD